MAAPERVLVTGASGTIIELSGVSLEPIVQIEQKEPVQLCADVTKANQILGFQPRIVLEAGLKQILEHMTYHLNNSGSVGQT